MLQISARRHRYAWGSTTALPKLVGALIDSQPWAELWYGAHESAPSQLLNAKISADLKYLDTFIARYPQQLLGAPIIKRHGERLPFLLKLVAPAKPLSLQLHPNAQQAQAGYAAQKNIEPLKSYIDPYHKPEIIFALEPFSALCGFRSSLRSLEILAGLMNLPGLPIVDFPGVNYQTKSESESNLWLTASSDDTTNSLDLIALMWNALSSDSSAVGMRNAFEILLIARERLSTQVLKPYLQIVKLACERRLETGKSPSVRCDKAVSQIVAQYPTDPFTLAPLLLNPVSLQPGEALYIPPGTLHSYLRGVGVEVMAASDNVLRAGLTDKPVDLGELRRCLQTHAAPPMRIAAEQVDLATQVFYAPVDDFQLSVTQLMNDSVSRFRKLAGRGPRICLVLEGKITFSTYKSISAINPQYNRFEQNRSFKKACFPETNISNDLDEISSSHLELEPGQAVFVGAQEELFIAGKGRLVQASVP